MNFVDTGKIVSLAVAIAIGITGSCLAAKPPADVEGKVRFFNVADTDFDVYSFDPGLAEQAWMREHYLRMLTYDGYFTPRLSWYPNAWAYKDAYAIKDSWPIFTEHPEWVLRDPEGNMLYIPWGCADGSCPQFAGDIGNPEFRANWIEEARILVELGYVGLWIDDVNLTWRISNGDSETVIPIDPRTGVEMELEDWRRYFAEFMEEVRAAFPTIEIAHNAIWFAGPTDNQFIRRQIDASDFYNFERGASDQGLVSGSGEFGFQSFLNLIDFVHDRGVSAILMDYGTTEQQRDYGLAAWFLISDGSDMLNSDQLGWTAPDSWWPGYELDLGEAIGPRFNLGSLIIREFECGVALLNQPGTPAATYELGREALDLSGNMVTSIRLEPYSGDVLTWCQAGPRPEPPTDIRIN